MTLIAGIDPGLCGAVAIFDCASNRLLDVWDIPTLEIKRGKRNKRRPDLSALDVLIEPSFPKIAFIEDVWGMPGQYGAFDFGRVTGTLEVFLFQHGVSMTAVAPQRWKRALQVNSDKDGCRFRASQLMPAAASSWARKKDDGRAEAALIAYYGALTLQGAKDAA